MKPHEIIKIEQQGIKRKRPSLDDGDSISNDNKVTVATAEMASKHNKKSAHETPDSEGVTSANHSKRKRDEQEDLKRVLKGNCFAELHA